VRDVVGVIGQEVGGAAAEGGLAAVPVDHREGHPVGAAGSGSIRRVAYGPGGESRVREGTLAQELPYAAGNRPR
jgi:hypothetical protein